MCARDRCAEVAAMLLAGCNSSWLSFNEGIHAGRKKPQAGREQPSEDEDEEEVGRAPSGF